MVLTTMETQPVVKTIRGSALSHRPRPSHFDIFRNVSLAIVPRVLAHLAIASLAAHCPVHARSKGRCPQWRGWHQGSPTPQLAQPQPRLRHDFDGRFQRVSRDCGSDLGYNFQAAGRRFRCRSDVRGFRGPGHAGFPRPVLPLRLLSGCVF